MTRRISKFAMGMGVVIVAIATVQILSTDAAFARDNYGAIATSDETGTWGYAYDYPTRARAEAEALRRCGDASCKVEVWFKNACGAVAKDDNNIGWGWAKTRAEAEARALSECGTGACKVEVWACTTR